MEIASISSHSNLSILSCITHYPRTDGGVRERCGTPSSPVVPFSLDIAFTSK